jgi:hypothetical protein
MAGIVCFGIFGYMFKPLQGAIRPLRQNLKRMLRAGGHHAEHCRDLIVCESFVKQVRHRVDEDPARLPPPQRQIQFVRHKTSFAVPLAQPD